MCIRDRSSSNPLGSSVDRRTGLVPAGRAGGQAVGGHGPAEPRGRGPDQAPRARRILADSGSGP
eukprot:9002288-Lingulodinium_polyedra.AAC.1